VFVSALMDLVIGHVAAAGSCLPHAPLRAQLIEEARTIIAALRDTLDLCDAGLAANLHDVYDYMCRQLGRELLGGRGSQLSEVAHLMHEVRAAWSAMPHRASARPA
jgi:flagellar protein FliS